MSVKVGESSESQLFNQFTPKFTNYNCRSLWSQLTVVSVSESSESQIFNCLTNLHHNLQITTADPCDHNWEY
jgi:hypothetical protein